MFPAAAKEIPMFCDGFIDYYENEMFASMSVGSIYKAFVFFLPKTNIEWD